jgi:UDP-glucose 4-epimerase
MKIAVTGGTGFLGKYVIDYIQSLGNTPIVITRKAISKNNTDKQYRQTDYSLESLIDILSDIDIVIHLAAKRGSQDRMSDFSDNIILTQNLYEACIINNIKNIIFASTISVYSEEKLLPWKETHLPKPKLMYGVSKIACEYIGNIYSTQKGLNIKNLRFAHIYGFNEKNNYMINLFFRQAFHKQCLSIYGNSVAKREFLYAKDAAKAIMCALEMEDISGTFNVGSGQSFTNYEVAIQINDVFDNKGNLIIKDPDADEGIQSSYMDNSKAKKILGFYPDYTFQDAIKEIYSQMKGLEDVPLFY